MVFIEKKTNNAALKIKACSKVHSDDSWKNAGFMGDLSPIYAVSFKRDYLLKTTNQISKSGTVDDGPLIEL